MWESFSCLSHYILGIALFDEVFFMKKHINASLKCIRYGVLFHRADGCPDEFFNYAHREDAEYHYRIMRNDDSGLYRQVDFLIITKGLPIISKSLHFDVEEKI